MNRRLLAILVLLFAALAVSAAPIDENVVIFTQLLDARKAKAAVKPKAAAKPPKVAVKPPVKASPVPAPVKTPATAPPLKAVPTAAKKPVVATTPVKASCTHKDCGASCESCVPSKGYSCEARGDREGCSGHPACFCQEANSYVEAHTRCSDNHTCPLPARKPPIRRFFEYIGILERADPADGCSTPSTLTPTTKEDKKAAKAAAKAAKDAKASAKAESAAAASASAEAAKRPIGRVSNAPTKAVQCKDRTGALVDIPLPAIQKAVELAQAGLLENSFRFPHEFRNEDGVRVAAACAGKTLEEQAVVGPNMSTFQNIPSVLANFNQFRVVITKPDATGATTFCGVMTHGQAGAGFFEQDLCAEV
ncbi:hypothetical protein B0H19DRAFT_1272877 [Mycena capillaripes]|nr:hypothetical protein B0H19DRAFT_1272877 [Mycena capillaripes]